MAENEEWESTKGSGNIWNPTKEANGDPKPVGTNGTDDDKIDGYYVDVKHNVGPNSQTLYTIQDDAGEKWGVWGCKALNDEMEKIRIGQYIRIKWIGKLLTRAGALVPEKQRTSLHSFHQYEVFLNKNRQPLSGVSGSNGTTTAVAPSAGIPKAQNTSPATGNSQVVDDLPF